MKVAVFGLKAKPELKNHFASFFEVLRDKGIKVTIEFQFLQIMKRLNFDIICDYETFSSSEDLQSDVDMMFTFGGDGTILDATTIIKERRIPIVGVNTGRLGFLATINVEILRKNIEGILAGNYNLSKRSLLVVETNSEPIEDSFALNEITVTRRETTSMITIEASLNGEFLNSFWADGLIISTPTGSTGYSMSCGGPIMHPSNKNFIVTPIAPHNLNVRPFIISDDSIIRLKIHSRVNEYFLSLDARNKPLSTDVELIIKKADFEIYIVEPKDKTYLMTLREKLLWGSDKRN